MRDFRPALANQRRPQRVAWRAAFRRAIAAVRAFPSAGITRARAALDALVIGLGRLVRAVVRTLWRITPYVAGALCMALIPVIIVYGQRFLRTSPHFRVQEVEVSGHANVPVEEVLEVAGVANAPNLLEVDVEAVRQSLELHPWIRAAKVQRELPNKLMIAVSERQPMAQLSLGGLYLVDRRGQPFKRVWPGEEYRLPILTGLQLQDFEPDTPIERRELADRLVRTALDLLDTWRRGPLGKRISVTEVQMDPLLGHGVVLGAADPSSAGATVHLGAGNFREKLARLETVLADARRRGKRVAAVHLDDPNDPGRVAVRFRTEDEHASGAAPEHEARRNRG